MSTTKVPAWSPTAIYTSGAMVMEIGVEYAANWWTQGTDPATNNGGAGSGEPWTVVSSSSPPPASPPQWSARAVYTSGATVMENGVEYAANWWTQGNDPATSHGGPGSGMPWSVVSSGSGAIAPPSTPTNLALMSDTASTASLSWNAATVGGGGKVTGYAVFENGIQLATVSGTSYTASGLSGGTAYSFTVAAIGNAGSSAQSAPLKMTTPASPVPAAPTNLTDSNLSSASLTLAWTAPATPPGATITSYTVLNDGVAIGTTTSASFAVTGLSPSTSYKLTVEAADQSGLSTPSAALSVTTPQAVQVPAAPTNLADSNLTSNSLQLAWTAPATPPGATITGYTILNDGVAIGTTTSTSFAVTGLSPSTTYSLAVEAADQYGLSTPSAALSITTSAGPQSSNPPDWNANTIYTAGMEASESGTIYTANYWTQGNDPASSNGAPTSGEPWTATGKDNTSPTAPNAPTGLTATAVSDSAIGLYWNTASVPGVGTVSGYAVFENGTEIATTANTYYNVNSLAASTAYDFTVEAIDATGASPQSAAASATTLAAGTQAPSTVYAPYIDVTLLGNQTLASISEASGVKDMTLAFIQSSGPGTIGWAGQGTIADDTLQSGQTIQQEINGLRAIGGNVIISFGGEAGTDPAVAAAADGESAATLQAEYQSVIDRYGVTSLDFDIEGYPEGDTASLKLRDEALVGLEQANPGLQISYTLPVLPTGLDYNGLAVVQAAKNDGVDVGVVNIMTMDYGSSVDNGGAMGTDAIDAIQATEKQLAGIGLAAKIGVTPLIGVNDVTSEVFSLADAQQLMSYVATDPDVVRVAMWSLGRDNGSTAGQDADVPTGSGIAQTNYEFSQIFDAPVSATLARLAQAAASLGGTSGAAATSPSVAVADTAATTTLAPNPLKH